MNVVIVGPGRMAISIAVALIQHEFNVTLLDIKARKQGQEMDSLNNAVFSIRSNLDLLKQLNRLEASPEELITKVHTMRGLDEKVKSANFIFETLPEKVEVKQNFYSLLGKYVQNDVVVASGTSTISLDLTG